MQRQTTIAKASEIQRKWYVVDATDKPLGRLVSQVAQILTGKVKPTWTPNVDCGDYVIIINAEKVSLSGDKIHNKKYYNVSGYDGGLRTRTANITTCLAMMAVLEQELRAQCSKNSHVKWLREVFTVWCQKDA